MRVSCSLQQWRLLPYLAAAYALDHFSKSLFLDLMQLQQGLLGDDRSARQVRTCPLSPHVCGYLNQTGKGSHACRPRVHPWSGVCLRGGVRTHLHSPRAERCCCGPRRARRFCSPVTSPAADFMALALSQTAPPGPNPADAPGAGSPRAWAGHGCAHPPRSASPIPAQMVRSDFPWPPHCLPGRCKR